MTLFKKTTTYGAGNSSTVHYEINVAIPLGIVILALLIIFL